ncbi:MAG: tetratricopeptide repeat protein [Pseudorhodobacter sp.]
MKVEKRLLNPVVAAFVGMLLCAPTIMAQTETLDRLYEELAGAEGRTAERIERRIRSEWSKSGSPSMDLLLQRGRDAMEEGDVTLAIEHLTALVDHAPDFAEGWNARALAYFQAGLYGPSVRDISRALALNPRHFDALTGFGRILEETEREEEALEVYESVLAIHPQLEGIRDSVERLRVKAAGQDL